MLCLESREEVKAHCLLVDDVHASDGHVASLESTSTDLNVLWECFSKLLRNNTSDGVLIANPSVASPFRGVLVPRKEG